MKLISATWALVGVVSVSAVLDSSNSNSNEGFPFYYSDLSDKARSDGYNVSYDQRSIIVDGDQRLLLISGSIHYPRLSPYQWDSVLDQAVDDGLNCIEIYFFWNLHDWDYDPNNGNDVHKYDLSGRANFTSFIEKCAQKGLFVNFRVGPYACAYVARIPDQPMPAPWLLHVEGIEFRTENEQWQHYMGQIVSDMMAQVEPYFARNGGPVILSQIENELHNAPQSYIDWCGDFAQSLGTGLVWIMCNGQSASNTINTCNGNSCVSFAQSHVEKLPNQPLMWTEDEGWFQSWYRSFDESTVSFDNRSPEEQAFVVAEWMAVGGCHHNYYMWHGGNHLDHWAGCGVANMYADGVNLHSDGLPNEPKKSHLAKLHQVLADYRRVLLSDDIQINQAIPLTPLNISDGGLVATVDTCDISGEMLTQQWQWDEQTTQLYYIDSDSKSQCIIATSEESNPAVISECLSSSDIPINQQWSYDEDSMQFAAKLNSELCLDVYNGVGPSVDLYGCKSASDSASIANQQWQFLNLPGAGHQIQSMLNGQCLTAQKKYDINAYVYKDQNNGDKVSFLVNSGTSDVSVEYDSFEYFVPNQSVSIISDFGEQLFNTARVNTVGVASQREFHALVTGVEMVFESWTEPFPINDDGSAMEQGLNAQMIQRSDNATMNESPLEQIRFSNESSEYLVYSTELSNSIINEIRSNSNGDVKLGFVGRKANAYLIFINDTFMDEVYNYDHNAGDVQFDGIDLSSYPWPNDDNGGYPCILTIVSSSLGIDNYYTIQSGATPDTVDQKGLVGSVTLSLNSDNQQIDLTKQGWSHFIGLTGEDFSIFDPNNDGRNEKVNWQSPFDTSSAMTWYRTEFTLSGDNGVSDLDGPPLLLDIGQMTSSSLSSLMKDDSHPNSMGRGHFYLNGVNMGHYNSVAHPTGVQQLKYEMTQRYYFLPKDYLKFGLDQTNEIVFCEELNHVNPISIRIVSSTMVIPE